jgi:hypothetical protein
MQPTTRTERLAQARQMVEELGVTILVLIDEMDNPVWCTYGPAPNNAYLIGNDGTVITKHGWYNPKKMETAIINHLASN